MTKVTRKKKVKAFEHIDVVVYAPKIFGEGLMRGKLVRLESKGKHGALMDLEVIAPLTIENIATLQSSPAPGALEGK